MPEADWQRRAQRSANSPNAKVTGWKPRYEVLSLAKGADAFVLCSYGEAMAMSLLENMYIKKLVLVSYTTGNRSVIQDSIDGYVFDTPEDYAVHIRQAMATFPSQLPEKAYRDIIKTYNTEVMQAKYVKFYEGLLQ